MFFDVKVGKSLIALFIGAHLATGRAVFGGQAGEPVDVVYIDQEMTVDDVREHLEDMGFGPDDDLSHLHYHLQTLIPPFDTLEGGEALLDIARFYGAQLAVIDTMAESVQGKENEADTYRQFSMYTGRRLKAEGSPCYASTTRGGTAKKGQRGSSAKNADVDVAFGLVRAKRDDGEYLTLNTRYSRPSWVPKSVSLRLSNENGTLHFELQEAGHPPGTSGVAANLDRLGVPLDASIRQAHATLRQAGKGKGNALVSAALKYRRERAEGVPGLSGNTSVPDLFGEHLRTPEGSS